MKKIVVVFVHLIFWFVIGLLYSFAWQLDGLFSGGHELWSIDFFNEVFTPLFIGGINFYLFYFVITIKYLKNHDYFKFSIYAILFSVFTSFLSLINISLLGYFEPFDFEVASIIFSLLFNLILGGLGSIMRIFFNWFAEQRYRQSLEKKNLETELALLKSQISPHFLFNTLNNIDVLIAKDAEKASVYMKKLSDILRFMLYETKDEVIPINLELEYIEKYIELQKIRTSNNSFVNFSINGKADELNIAPMIFIPFIENAFKHTSNKKTIDAITIRFDVLNDTIKFYCENFKHKSGNLIQKQSGLGINLIEQRLDLLYKDKHTLKIENSDEKYFVTLTIQLNED